MSSPTVAALVTTERYVDRRRPDKRLPIPRGDILVEEVDHGFLSGAGQPIGSQGAGSCPRAHVPSPCASLIEWPRVGDRCHLIFTQVTRGVVFSQPPGRRTRRTSTARSTADTDLPKSDPSIHGDLCFGPCLPPTPVSGMIRSRTFSDRATNSTNLVPSPRFPLYDGWLVIQLDGHCPPLQCLVRRWACGPRRSPGEPA